MDGNQIKIIMSAFLNKHLMKIEIPGAVFFFTGWIMMEENIQGGSIITGLCLTVLASLYYLLAFMPTEEQSIISIISQKVIGISSSIIMVGIMFQLHKLNGANIMLTVGLSSLFMATVLLLIGSSKNEQGIKNKANIFRALIILVVGSFIYYYPAI